MNLKSPISVLPPNCLEASGLTYQISIILLCSLHWNNQDVLMNIRKGQYGLATE